MGDHGIDVHFGESGRHRAGADRAGRPDASALLDMLTVLQSTLGEATRSGDQAGIRAAAAGRAACWVALADLADEVHPAYALACRRLARVDGGCSDDGSEGAGDDPVADSGRHSAVGRAESAGALRPRTVTTGRHAVERPALRRPVARSGRHRAPDEPTAADQPAARQTHADQPVAHQTHADRPAAHRLSTGAAVRRRSVAAVLERAVAHETPVTALRPAPIPVPRRVVIAAAGIAPAEAGDTVAAVRAGGTPVADTGPGRTRAAGVDAAEWWAVEQWARHAGGEWTAPDLWSAPAPDGEWSPARDEQPTVSDWMPTQRRGEPEAPRRPCDEPDPTAEVVRPTGWHPVPRPRHAADDRPAPTPSQAKLAG